MEFADLLTLLVFSGLCVLLIADIAVVRYPSFCIPASVHFAHTIRFFLGEFIVVDAGARKGGSGQKLCGCWGLEAGIELDILPYCHDIRASPHRLLSTFSTSLAAKPEPEVLLDWDLYQVSLDRFSGSGYTDVAVSRYSIVSTALYWYMFSISQNIRNEFDPRCTAM